MDKDDSTHFFLKGFISKFRNLSVAKSTTIIIVVIYAFLSELWILFSDKLFLGVTKYISYISNWSILEVSIVKGTLYVVLSSTLLFYVLRNHLIKIHNLKSELLESEERYRKLIKLLPDAVTITRDNKYLFTNDAGAKLFGFNKSEEILDISLESLVHPKYHKLALAREQLTQYNNVEVPLVEQKYIRTDGSVIDVEITSSTFNYKGKSSTLSVVRDVTERKKIEESLKKTLDENTLLLNKMLELDKIKTEFFSNMSHEFKTPLNIIFGTVQVLNNYRSDDKINITIEKYDKYTGLIKQNCYRLLRLINNLIDISKIDSGYLEMNYKNYNIISVIENITLSVVEFAENKGLSIIFDTEVEEKYMCCDTDKIERIMLNLLSNAIKNTMPGGTINVNIYDNEDSVTISVKDTGIGIPEDKLKIIFDRFMQVDPSLQRKNGGSGIGLALVKSLVESHNGQAWVTSKQGEGTEFFVKLPVKILPNEIEEKPDDNSCDNLVEKINIEFSDIYSL